MWWGGGGQRRVGLRRGRVAERVAQRGRAAAPGVETGRTAARGVERKGRGGGGRHCRSQSQMRHQRWRRRIPWRRSRWGTWPCWRSGL